MLRKITTAQKRTEDYHKSDVLAQTNDIVYDCFVLHGTENTKFIFLRSNSRDKNPGHVSLDFVLLFIIAKEKFGKKIIWSSWSSRKRFF